VARGTGVGSRGSPRSEAPSTMWRRASLCSRALLARAWSWSRREVPFEASYPGPSANERARMEEAERVSFRCTRSLTPRQERSTPNTLRSPLPSAAASRARRIGTTYHHVKTLLLRTWEPATSLPRERVSLRLSALLGRSPRSSRRWGKLSTGRRGAVGQQCGSAAN